MPVEPKPPSAIRSFREMLTKIPTVSELEAREKIAALPAAELAFQISARVLPGIMTPSWERLLLEDAIRRLTGGRGL